jgi:hypothetical protein
MNRYTLFAIVPVLFAVTAGVADADQGKKHALFARLQSVNEVPSVISTGSGEFRAKIADDETSIEFKVSLNNLQGTPAQGHIHVGQPFTSGGISAFLCGGGGQPDCPSTSSATFTGTITAANMDGRAAAQGVAQGDFAKLLDAIRAQATYANIHTTQFLGGEVRGQILAF